MKKIIIEENLTGQKLEKLLEIVAQSSTMISVARYCSDDEKCDDFKDRIRLQGFNDFIEIKYTNETPVTSGPKFEILYFQVGKTFQRLKTELPSLFNFPYTIIGKCYEDIAFYKDSRVVMAVCSHEQFARLDLTDKEYIMVKELGILEYY